LYADINNALLRRWFLNAIPEGAVVIDRQMNGVGMHHKQCVVGSTLTLLLLVVGIGVMNM
jgi:hypothetical protein